MSWRKGSTVSVDTSGGSNTSRPGTSTKPVYPFAHALRLRVIQIVCGIAAIVMGSVAALEERQHLNLSMGVPAGAMTVLAAGWSVHRSIHRSCRSRRVVSLLFKFLWLTACSLLVALFVLAARTMHYHEFHSKTSVALAAVQAVLATSTLVAAAFVLRLRWLYGPAPSGAPNNFDGCPRSTSHTAVSMVPLASAYGCQSIVLDRNEDNLSSDNETLEINITANKSENATPAKTNQDTNGTLQK